MLNEWTVIQNNNFYTLITKFSNFGIKMRINSKLGIKVIIVELFRLIDVYLEACTQMNAGSDNTN